VGLEPSPCGDISRILSLFFIDDFIKDSLIINRNTNVLIDDFVKETLNKNRVEDFIHCSRYPY